MVTVVRMTQACRTPTNETEKRKTRFKELKAVLPGDASIDRSNYFELEAARRGKFEGPESACLHAACSEMNDCRQFHGKPEG